MAPLRLRHPKGISTLQVPLENDAFTVRGLQQEIYTITGISPSRQQLKSGYPPTALTLVPELPISSLGIKSGDQILVSEGGESITLGAAPARPQANNSSFLNPLQSLLPRGLSSSGPDYVETDAGVLIHRVVPDDNSCLFSAISLVFEQSIDNAQKMRQIVVEGIRKDLQTYNEAILGMPPDQYITIIRKPSTWGGAIELTILAAHFNTEIASIDVETGRVDNFTPPTGGSGMRCILIYSGIHYDAASLAPFPNAAKEWHQTLFPISGSSESDPIVVAGKKLADILRSKRAYTNTATFDLRCEICGTGLKGEKEARAHAEQTGHVRFGEY
ncbi:hypothetical protein JOM56_003410 [Amanita muscaria]